MSKLSCSGGDKLVVVAKPTPASLAWPSPILT
jgi:hypothetical protein